MSPGTTPLPAPAPQPDPHRVVPALALVLHAHLPFVRHPEHPEFLEERWLFEAIIECYLPLLQMLDGWARDAVPGRLTLTVSPTLAAMLADPFLRDRFDAHLGRMRDLARQEEQRHLFQPAWLDVARFHRERLNRIHATWQEIRRDLLGAWRGHAEAGRIEILACAATHALLPLLTELPGALRGQLLTAVAEHRRHFGSDPRGIWLPECAYTPAIEPALHQAGFRWFVLETHGLLLARPAPPQGVLSPVLTPTGLAAFARDPASARQVWSRHGGYPGDPRYREFHRDLADDAEWGYLAPFTAGTDVRVPTGIRYHRVTGPDLPKELYQPGAALAATREHAAHFIAERIRQFHHAAPGQPAVLVTPYDAELFGHWWFEGPDFLDAVARGIAADPAALRMTTLGDHLKSLPALPVCTPADSTWGEGGHLAVWLDDSNAWMQRPLRRMAVQMARYALAGGDDPLRQRALRQAARELLLAQASDWPFLIRMGTARDYAQKRFHQHVADFDRLIAHLSGREPWDPSFLATLESRDNLFPSIDPTWWSNPPEAPEQRSSVAVE